MASYTTAQYMFPPGAQDTPSCEEPCACFGDFNDSNLNALFPGTDDSAFTAYRAGLYVEVKSRVLCGGQLISADFCVFSLLSQANDMVCNWTIQMGLFRLLDDESYAFVEGSDTSMRGDSSEFGFVQIRQCFLRTSFGAPAPTAEPGDHLAVHIQLSGNGCTVFPFYTTSDTSTLVYYQSGNNDASLNQLSPIPASSIANTSNHLAVRVNARFHISSKQYTCMYKIVYAYHVYIL